MEEEHHRLPGQVRGSTRKSCSKVSHSQRRLQMLLGRVSDTVIRKKTTDVVQALKSCVPD